MVSKWRMVINRDKTQIVHYRKAKVPFTQFKFNFDGEPLDIVSEYKYLGIFLDEHMSFQSNTRALEAACKFGRSSDGRHIVAVRRSKAV